MNVITKTTSVAVLVALGLALGAWAAEPPKPEPQKGNDAAGKPPKHRFLCVDNGQPNRLIHVDQRDPARDWSVEVPGPTSRDLQIVAGNRVLVSHSTGCAEYDLADGRKTWSVEGFHDVQTAQRLPNGHTLLGANTDKGARVWVVDRGGKTLATRILHPDRGSLRLVRVLDNGNALLNVGNPYRAVEVDPNGQVVWETDLARFGGKGYKVARLYDGHTMATTGDGVKVVVVAPDGNLVRFYGAKTKDERPEWRLDFFSGFDALPNGNVIVANWLGHGKHGAGPHLVEFDSANTLIWQWADHRLAKQITNVLVLDGYVPALTAAQEQALEAILNIAREHKRIRPVTRSIGAFSVAQAYEIQDRYTLRMAERLGPVAGHKVAYASSASQKRWGMNEPAGGRLFAAQRVPDGGVVSASGFLGFHIEAEVAFVVGKRIARPLANIGELKSYVRSAHVGLDIPDNRFDASEGDPGVADVIASGCGAHRWAIGPAVDPAGLDFGAIRVTLTRNGETVYKGDASAVMGDPWNAMLWQVNDLVKRGFALEPGEVVLTGAVAAAYVGSGEAAAGVYVGEAGPLGKVVCTVVESAASASQPGRYTRPLAKPQ